MIPAHRVDSEAHECLALESSDSELRYPDGETGTNEAGGLARTMVLLEVSGHGAETGELGVDRMMTATATGASGANAMCRVHVPTSAGDSGMRKAIPEVTVWPSPWLNSTIKK